MAVDKSLEEITTGDKMPASLSTDGATTTEELTKGPESEEFEKDWKKVALIMMSLYLTMFLVALVSLPLINVARLDLLLTNPPTG
jgi:hypothetical protein